MTVNWDDQSKSSKKMTSSVFRNVFIRFYESNNPSISLLDINIELKLILAHFGIILAHCASVPCIGEKYPMHVKEPTSLLAKSKKKSR